MGWICVIDACNGHITNGLWDGTGIAFFSISEEISILHDIFFSYFMTLTMNAYMFMMLTLVITAVVSIIISVKMVVKKSVGR